MSYSADEAVLNCVNSISDLKKLPIDQLETLCSNIRQYIIKHTIKNGGHLGASLGTVELTVALHYVFDVENGDRMVWDIGHQSYTHKILTGRKDAFKNLRCHTGGITGFANPKESKYDHFIGGHSSTAIASTMGIAVGTDKMLNKGSQRPEIITIIGDGAMSAGIAFESINNISQISKRGFIILNDNDKSISPSVGGLRDHLTSLRKDLKLKYEDIESAIDSVNLQKQNNLFTNLGCLYIGVVDGHNILLLVKLFTTLLNSKINRTVVIHLETEKGHGYDPAKSKQDKMHSIRSSSDQTSDSTNKYTNCFSKCLAYVMEQNELVVAVSAGMKIGTGLTEISEEMQDRVFDVGIAEQFAVTFSAGMASAGLRPFCAVYSTFLQRAYDQLIHDVAIQSLPVIFAIDRAGYVGIDGATHNGSFDMAFLRILPNFVIMAPSSGVEMAIMIKTALSITDKPVAIRYPRETDAGICPNNMDEFNSVKLLQIGKAKIIENGKDCCIISIGSVLDIAKRSRLTLLQNYQIETEIIDARFVKPLDEELFKQIASRHKLIVAIEDGSCGGFGSALLEFLSENKYNGNFISFCHSKTFLDGMSVEMLYRHSGLDHETISRTIHLRLEEMNSKCNSRRIS